jgi:hypothetical protein
MEVELMYKALSARFTCTCGEEIVMGLVSKNSEQVEDLFIANHLGSTVTRLGFRPLKEGMTTEDYALWVLEKIAQRFELSDKYTLYRNCKLEYTE